MIHKVFAVRDAAGEMYGHPFLQTTRALAIRHIKRGMQDPKSNLVVNAKDFTLMEIGEYNDETAELIGKPVSIVNHISDLLDEAVDTH